MQSNIVIISLWLVCGAVTVLAARWRAGTARRVTSAGPQWACCSPPAAPWCTWSIWRLAAAGMLVLTGGRRTQAGYLAVIAFYAGLWLFGWMETVGVLIMLPAMLLLLHAELRAPAVHHRPSSAILRHA